MFIMQFWVIKICKKKDFTKIGWIIMLSKKKQLYFSNGNTKTKKYTFSSKFKKFKRINEKNSEKKKKYEILREKIKTKIQET